VVTSFLEIICVVFICTFECKTIYILQKTPFLNRILRNDYRRRIFFKFIVNGKSRSGDHFSVKHERQRVADEKGDAAEQDLEKRVENIECRIRDNKKFP
jgi:hypothetical protein